MAYILETDFQCVIPKKMQASVASFIQKEAEKTASEISSTEVWDIFNQEFVNRDDNLVLDKINIEPFDNGQVILDVMITYNRQKNSLSATRNGPINASKKALTRLFSNLIIDSYSEHSLSHGSDSQAICYISILFDDVLYHGAGIDTNLTQASIKALFSAINRRLNMKQHG